MKTYALIDSENNVVNTAVFDDSENPSAPAGCEYIASDDAKIGDTYIDGVFTSPISLLPKLTNDELLQSAQSQITSWISLASSKINPLQDANELGMATDSEKTSLTAWKTFRVLVNRVPTQPGYPDAIDWPPMPE